MIRTEQLTKCFGGVRAVDGLNLDIAAGEFFAFLGPNGAGKTTTIKLLTGLLKPSAGRALICGHDIQREPMEARKQIAYVPDLPFLYDKLAPLEFMYFVGQLYGMAPGAIEQSSRQLFELFDLTGSRDKLIETLSHGTRQRLVIASALLHDPKVLIIDEPIVGLDPRSARLVKDTLKKKTQEGLTVFMSTHLLEIVEELCDRIAIIKSGRIIYDSPAAGHNGRLERMFLELTK